MSRRNALGQVTSLFVRKVLAEVAGRVDEDALLRTGIPEELFTLDADIRGGDKAPDGRFLVIKPVEVVRDGSVTVVLNGFRQIDGKKP